MAVSRFNPDYPDAGLVLLNKTAFTGASTVSIDNVFNSTYDNYKISIVIDDGSWTTGNDITFNFRTSTDDTSNSYNSMTILIGNTGGTGSYGAGTRTFAYIMPYTATNKEALGVLDVYSPNKAEKTLMTFQSLSENLSIVGGIFTTTTTQYTGFSFRPVSSNMTGTLRIYGYKNEV